MLGESAVALPPPFVFCPLPGTMAPPCRGEAGLGAMAGVFLQEEATYIQEIMATADGQMVQHLVTTENQVSPLLVAPGGDLGVCPPTAPHNPSPASLP